MPSKCAHTDRQTEAGLGFHYWSPRTTYCTHGYITECSSVATIALQGGKLDFLWFVATKQTESTGYTNSFLSYLI